MSEIKARDWGWLGENVINDPKTEYIVMQFTGHKDKTGKEICEGDIIVNTQLDKVRNIERIRSKRIVEWRQSSMGIGLNLGMVRDATTHIKIIGNIYENPELLKTK